MKTAWLAWGLLTLSGFSHGAYAQEKKKIEVEDIWARPVFRQRMPTGINWMKDGKSYTSQAVQAGGISHVVKYDIVSGKSLDTLANGKTLIPDGAERPLFFEDYSFNASETALLFETESEPIYRRSSKAQYYIYDIASKKLSKLSEGGAQSYPTFSPDGKKIAFVRANNLFVKDLASGQEQALTTDGKVNEIINGSCDWVYEEEFEFAQAFFWSPDSKKIAFYTFDERAVPEYNMQVWGDLYPQDYRYKYPKAGEKNSVVSIKVHHLDLAKTVVMDLGAEKDQYIPRVKWTQNADLLSIRRMNRLQNKLDILHAEVSTGKTTVVLSETSPTYIDINDDLTYLPDGKSFIHTSELKGYKHAFQYSMDGKLIRQITQGNWEIAEFLGYNAKNQQLYFTSTEAGATQRHLYTLKVDGKGKKLLSPGTGWHSINFAPGFTYFIDNYSSANVPPVFTLYSGEGKSVRVMEDNAPLKATLDKYLISPRTFFSFKTSQGVELNGWMIKPANYDASKKYPVFMFVYGGPGSQTVKDEWEGGNQYWFQSIAQKGYIVVSVDGRGTGARGNDFKKTTYAQLGKYETEDQIEAAKWLGQQSYVDKDRIGIFGWSFGGYMTALCLTKGADVFKAGISVAPVTNWRFYDSIYTERFLKTPQENASGYDDNSPVRFANLLKGKFLLVHGTGDDNVHVQNAFALTDALIKANKPFESFYYPNRNHGIYGGNTRLHLYKMMSQFIEKNL